jgi:hypothetical protein
MVALVAVLKLAATMYFQRSYKMYRLTTPHPTTGEINCVKRLSDGAFVTFDPTSTDYQAYLAWLAEGNTPLPADES